MAKKRDVRKSQGFITAAVHALLIAIIILPAGAAALYFLFLLFLYAALAIIALSQMGLRECLIAGSFLVVSVIWILRRLFFRGDDHSAGWPSH